MIIIDSWSLTHLSLHPQMVMSLFIANMVIVIDSVYIITVVISISISKIRLFHDIIILYGWILGWYLTPGS